MACALACAIWDHAEKLSLAAPDDPPSLFAECYKWETVEMRHTYADPWEDPLARVWGVLERDLGLIVRSALLDELIDPTSMEELTLILTYSYHIPITLMQAL